MKILMINKFLYPKGGSETYIQKLGVYLQRSGHEVQYFGMEHPRRTMGNRAEVYTKQMDFHAGAKLAYAVKPVYSSEARRKLRQVLEDFQPDVCHLNNFHYQLTPSILLEIRKWEREGDRRCRIVATAHDYQLVCPNHMCRNPKTGKNCGQCLDGTFFSCIRGRCIHGSLAKSIIGAAEAIIWNRAGIYRQIDTILCCSHFLKEKLDRNPILAERTVAMHNFVEEYPWSDTEKQDYVLYFGRYSQEKGIGTLLSAAAALPDIPFVFAGSGPMAEAITGLPNVRNMGFRSGERLETLIREARFTVYPSQWLENCPLSILESISMGTPVLAADIGGIPELVREGITGELFESGNEAQLREKIQTLWNHPEILQRYMENCKHPGFVTPEQYCENLMNYYIGRENP